MQLSPFVFFPSIINGDFVILLSVLLHFFKSMTEHLFQGIVDEEQTRVLLGFHRILSSSSSSFSPSFTAAPRNSGRSILTLTFQATGEPKRRRDVRRRPRRSATPINRGI